MQRSKAKKVGSREKKDRSTNQSNIQRPARHRLENSLKTRNEVPNSFDQTQIRQKYVGGNALIVSFNESIICVKDRSFTISSVNDSSNQKKIFDEFFKRCAMSKTGPKPHTNRSAQNNRDLSFANKLSNLLERNDLSGQDGFERFAVLFDPEADVMNDSRGVPGGLPAEIGLNLAGVRHVNSKIDAGCLRH
jgi:hypothetical protein